MVRPLKLNTTVLHRLTQALSMGATQKLACQFAGISEHTLIAWKKRGEEEALRVESGKSPREKEHEFLTLFTSLQKAEGEAAILWLAKIEQAATEHWQAAAWKLERRYPQDYGRQVQDVNHSGEVTHGFKVYRFPARARDAHDWELAYGRQHALPPAAGDSSAAP